MTETVLETPVAKPRSRLRKWSFRLFVAFAVMLPVAGGVFTFVYLDAYQSNVGELSFRNQVRIPPLLEPTVDANGTKRFQLSLQTGTTEFLPGKPAQGWGGERVLPRSDTAGNPRGQGRGGCGEPASRADNRALARYAATGGAAFVVAEGRCGFRCCGGVRLLNMR